jgi:hypothetical protein
LALTISSVPRLLSLNVELLSANSALLIPRQSPNAIIPLTPALLTSQDTPFSVKPSGVIITAGAPSTKLLLQSPGSSDLKGYISSFSGSQLVDSGSSHYAFIFTPPSIPLNLETAYLSVIPLLPSSSEVHHLSVPLSSIKSTFVSQTSQLAIYSDSSAKAAFLSPNAGTCMIESGFGGSQWLFSPVHELASAVRRVKVAVLVPHMRVIVPAHNHRLPTPPPSPPLLSSSQMDPFQTMIDARLETDRDRANTVVLPTSSELHVKRIPALTWKLLALVIDLILWFLITLLECLFQLIVVPPSTNYDHAILSDSVQHKSGSPSSPVTGMATPTISVDERSEVVSTIEQHPDEKLADVKENEGNAQQLPPPFVVDINGGQGQIRLLVGGKEQDVRGLKFALDGKKIKVASITKDEDEDDDDAWLVELAGGSGRLNVRL